MKFNFLVAIGLVVLSSAAFGSRSENFSDTGIKGELNLFVARSKPSGLTSGTYNQSIDHFGQLAGQTFSQRYWVDSEYATGANAPVIYHICGEADVDQSYFLSDNAIAWAQALGAHLVFLEHRYYGQSLPFADLSTAHMQYLTLGNELEDLAGFQKWLATTQGLSGPWISVGGSYSGTISALYRQAHPELVAGALASSAPMIAGTGQATDQDSDNITSIDPSVTQGARQWIYQACTTFNFWVADGPYPSNTVFTPSAALCQMAFGSGIAMADPNVYNQKYDAPFIAAGNSSPTHILFTYGTNDVWTNIGLAQQTNANPGIQIQLIQGAGHHFDLNAPASDDSDAVKSARTLFVNLVKGWIAGN